MQAVSQQDYTDAAAAARAGRSRGRAEPGGAADTAQINLRFTRVPAPITGRIGRSLVTTGALVTANQTDPLATIQRLDPIFVDIQQSSGQLLALRQRDRHRRRASRSAPTCSCSSRTAATTAIPARVEFAEAVVDPSTGTVTLRASFPNPQGLLLPGMYVRARLVQQTVANAILVPQAGVSRDPQGNATVMVVGPGNKADAAPDHRRPRRSATSGSSPPASTPATG